MSWMSESDKSSEQLYVLRNINEQLHSLTKLIADDIKTKKESKFKRKLKRIR